MRFRLVGPRIERITGLIMYWDVESRRDSFEAQPHRVGVFRWSGPESAVGQAIPPDELRELTLEVRDELLADSGVQAERPWLLG